MAPTTKAVGGTTDVGQALSGAGAGMGGARLDRREGLSQRCMTARSPTRDGFWGEIGRRIDWIKPYTRVKNTSFDPGNVSIKWFEDGTLNVCANCIDRHLPTRGDQVAIIWEGDDPDAATSRSPIASCTSASAGSPTS